MFNNETNVLRENYKRDHDFDGDSVNFTMNRNVFDYVDKLISAKLTTYFAKEKNEQFVMLKTGYPAPNPNQKQKASIITDGYIIKEVVIGNCTLAANQLYLVMENSINENNKLNDNATLIQFNYVPVFIYDGNVLGLKINIDDNPSLHKLWLTGLTIVLSDLHYRHTLDQLKRENISAFELELKVHEKNERSIDLILQEELDKKREDTFKLVLNKKLKTVKDWDKGIKVSEIIKLQLDSGIGYNYYNAKRVLIEVLSKMDLPSGFIGVDRSIYNEFELGTITRKDTITKDFYLLIENYKF